MGVRVDHGALEAELGHRALEFFGGFLRILRCDRGDAGESCGVLGDGRCELVVAGSCDRDRGGAVEDLHSGTGQRQYLHVDAGRIHVLYTTLIEKLQLLDNRPRPVARAVQVEAPQAVEARVIECSRGEQLAIQGQQLGRGEGFLGRDALVREAVT